MDMGELTINLPKIHTCEKSTIKLSFIGPGVWDFKHGYVVNENGDKNIEPKQTNFTIWTSAKPVSLVWAVNKVGKKKEATNLFLWNTCFPVSKSTVNKEKGKQD